jgi:uncharacterized protein YceK
MAGGESGVRAVVNLASTGLFVIAGLLLAGCSTIESVLDSGRGPFDKSPATSNEAALEGLHESSWGNSGKWGGKKPPENDPEVAVPEKTEANEDEPPRA